jgi:hypothetical protein
MIDSVPSAGTPCRGMEEKVLGGEPLDAKARSCLADGAGNGVCEGSFFKKNFAIWQIFMRGNERQLRSVLEKMM